jgi:hypothetical protein
MTVIKDTTFVNYKYQPNLGWYRPSVFYVSLPLPLPAQSRTWRAVAWWQLRSGGKSGYFPL